MPTDLTAFVGFMPCGPLDTPVEVGSFDEYASEFGAIHPGSTVSFAVQGFFRNGGRRAVVVRTGGVSGRRAAARLVPLKRNGRGLYALDGYGYVGLVCIPPVTMRGHLGPGIVARAAAYCAERRAFLVVDAPAKWRGADASQAAAYRSAYRSNAAMYLPRVRVGRHVVPPSGAVAGVIARSDVAYGVWRAPAGRNALLDVDGLAYELTNAELKSLTAEGVNCLRTLLGSVVVWGARTLAGSQAEASEWKYVSLRRLLLFLEASIDEGTGWVVFEPNDEPLWARVRGAVEAFLVNLWRAGAFQGQKAEEGFFVRCDRTTMTQEDIDSGRLILLVGVAPIKPAEFVTFRICQKTAAA